MAANQRRASRNRQPSFAVIFALLSTTLGAVAPASASPVVVGRDRIDVGETIPFAPASTTVPPAANALLDALAQALKENPRFTLVRIEGHTDATGATEVNQSLSQARADAVRQALIDRGVPAKRIVAKGFGASDPIESNATDLGRRRNRRVVVEVLQIEGKSVQRPPLAKISEKRNQVAARAPLEKRWKDATVGDGLRRSWRVRTEEDSAAGITFRDASRLAMREQTLVIIYGATEAATRQAPRRAALQTGALATWLEGGDGQPTALTVQTESGDARFTGGRAVARTTTSPEQKRPAVAFSNQSGQTARVSGKDQSGRRIDGVVEVKRGYGSRVVAGNIPDPPVPLPPPPTLALDAPVAIALGHQGATATGQWTVNASAPLDRILFEVLALSREGEAPLRINVDAKTKGFRLQNLPPGQYAIKAAAIDRLGLEGPFSNPQSLEVQALRTVDANEVESIFIAGAALVVPDGWKCAVDTRDFDDATALVLRPTTERVRCQPLAAPASTPAAIAALSVTPAPKLSAPAMRLSAGERADVVLQREKPWTKADTLAVLGGKVLATKDGPGARGRTLTVDIDPTAAGLVVEGRTRDVVVSTLQIPVTPDTMAPRIESALVTQATERDMLRVSVVVTDVGAGVREVLAQVTGRRAPAPVALEREAKSDTFVGALPAAKNGEQPSVTLWATDRAGNGPVQRVVAMVAPPGLGPLWLALPAAALPFLAVSLGLLADAALAPTTGGPLAGRFAADLAGQNPDATALATWQSLAATATLVAAGAVAATGAALFLTSSPAE